MTPKQPVNKGLTPAKALINALRRAGDSHNEASAFVAANILERNPEAKATKGSDEQMEKYPPKELVKKLIKNDPELAVLFPELNSNSKKHQKQVKQHTPKSKPVGEGTAGKLSTIMKVEFAKSLRAKLLELGISQSELARRAGLGRDSISGYIRGRSLPNPVNIDRLAKALGVNAEELCPSYGLGADAIAPSPI